jgi:pimeloyl-ACP methyl ester carboxylesterase
MMSLHSSPARGARQVFVLVHPAWHGGWCWRKVVPILRRRGHRVLTPTLTGLGERSHLLQRGVGLDVHIGDVSNVLTYEDLRDVIVVGHSSSGAVVTGVADRALERIAQVVYLDAFVPEDGQSVFDLIAPERRASLEGLVRSEGDGWLLPRFAPPAWETIVREMWGVTDDDDVHWMVSRLGPTPIGHFTDAVRVSNPSARKLMRAYVRCLRFPSTRFDEHARMAQRGDRWRYRELPTSHHPFVTAPETLADVLCELAG